MRTTVTIQDGLLAKAREASMRRNCSIGEVIDDALRSSLVAQPKSARQTARRPLKTFRGTGLQPGVELVSSAELLEVMERE